MNRHSYALDDFNKVLQLTTQSFFNAHLMIARIHAKDGQFDAARDSVKSYTKLNKNPTPDTIQLLEDVDAAEKAAKNMQRNKDAQLWTACVENASLALKSSSHSIDIRQTRAECALASGDVEGAVGDLTCVFSTLALSVYLRCHPVV